MRIVASSIAAVVLERAHAIAVGISQVPDWQDSSGDSDDDVQLQNMLPPTVQLAMDSPCAPDVDHVKELELLSAQEGPRTLPKFFLYDSGAFDLSNTVRCFLKEVGSDNWVDNLDMHVLPNVAEHLTDYRLLGRLKTHPARTMNESEAEFFIVGAPVGTSYHAARLETKACGRQLDHQMRMKNVQLALEALPTFQRQASRFMIIDTDWNWFDIVTPPFAELIKKKEVILATSDLMIAGYGEVERSNVVVIPYKAHFILEDAAFKEQQATSRLNLKLSSTSSSKADVVRRLRGSRTITIAYDRDEGDEQKMNGPQSRNVSFAFHGLMGRKNDGNFRYCMRQMSVMLPATSVQDVSFYSYAPDAFSQIASDTAETLLKSQFCFVPAGDTPSSRRLFDALAAGCVPIIFNSMEEIAPSLPFRYTVDWPSIAVFAGDLGCVASQMGSTVYWLNQLLDVKGLNAWSVEVMRQKGRKVFRDWLSYRSPGIAGALLAELGKLRPSHI